MNGTHLTRKIPKEWRNFPNLTYLYGSQIPNECKLNQIIKLYKNSQEHLTKIINKLFAIKSQQKIEKQQEKNIESSDREESYRNVNQDINLKQAKNKKFM